MIEDFKSVFSGKKVFVTGHTGFKGAWLVSWLFMLGAEVKGYALAPKQENDLYNLLNGDELCASEIEDINDAEKLRQSILEFQPDFIFHLAAQALVRLSYELPISTFATNVMGSIHVLDALRYLEKHCIVVMVTTDKVYQNLEKAGYHYAEDDRLGGHDPYSASKAAAEIAIDAYRKSFFPDEKYTSHQKSISIARAGNVIGGGDWSKDRIIPDVVRALSKDEIILLRNPNAVRPWQHVLESLNGYLTLALKQKANPLEFSGAYNFGPKPSDNLTVEQLVMLAIEVWGKGNFTKPPLVDEPHEAILLQLAIDKAVNVLNWRPRYDAATAIRQTIGWYKKVIIEGSSDARSVTFEQIQQYSKSIGAV